MEHLSGGEAEGAGTLFTLQMMRLGRDVPSANEYLIGRTKKTGEDFSGWCPVRGQNVMGSDWMKCRKFFPNTWKSFLLRVVRQRNRLPRGSVVSTPGDSRPNQTQPSANCCTLPCSEQGLGDFQRPPPPLATLWFSSHVAFLITSGSQSPAFVLNFCLKTRSTFSSLPM